MEIRKYEKSNIVIPDDITDEKERKKYYAREFYKLNKKRLLESQRKWHHKNREEVIKYQKEYYKKQKEGKDIKLLREREDIMCLAEEFIEQIERQGGWCDDLQAFKLTHYYSEVFGATWNRKYENMEDELSYMYLRLKKTVEKGSIVFDEEGQLLVGSKVCITCGYDKPVSEYNKDRRKKDGLRTQCKSCVNEYQREYFRRNPHKKEEYLIKQRKNK